MDWLESKLELVWGADNEPLPGSSAGQIAELAEHALDGDAMVDFVRDFFVSQKSFSDYIGVGESTVAGWMKSRSFPAYAKRAALAAYFARKHWGALSEARRDARRPKVVKDGDRYLIVSFKKDEAGVWFGNILARDIENKNAALLFASGVRAWELLGQAEEVIDLEIENRDSEDAGGLVELKEEIRLERTRTIAHDWLLEAERENARKRQETAAVAGAEGLEGL